MPKTDKELAVEIVVAYINGWFSKEDNKPIDMDKLKMLIDNAYLFISNLPTDSANTD